MEGSHKLYEKGWKHLRCEGPDEAALREKAEEWLLEGRLFPGHKSVKTTPQMTRFRDVQQAIIMATV